MIWKQWFIRSIAVLVVCHSPVSADSLAGSAAGAVMPPSEVPLAVSREILGHFEAIYASRQSPLPQLNTRLPTARARHVAEKSREVLFKLGRMNRLYDFSAGDIEVPLDHQSADDLLALVNAHSQRLRDKLLGHQQGSVIEPRSLMAHDPMTEVHDNLSLVSMAVEGLLPGIGPADVHLTMQLVLQDLHAVRAATDRQLPLPFFEFQRNQTPSDVYRQLMELLIDIKRLSTKQQYLILDGVFLPVVSEDRKVPGDVLALASIIRAELTALKQLTGASMLPDPVYREPERTPPDVFRQILQARYMVDAL